MSAVSREGAKTFAGMTPRCRDAGCVRSLRNSPLIPSRRAFGPPQDEGGGAPKSANLWCPRSLAGQRRAPLGAPHALKHMRSSRPEAGSASLNSACYLRRLLRDTPGPALVRSVAHLRADRAFSQLLAGTPNGPGGSPGAARVPCCDKIRGRRTPSRYPRRLMNAPLNGRGGCRINEVWRAGISWGFAPVAAKRSTRAA
jgi:hypothetical protein